MKTITYKQLKNIGIFKNRQGSNLCNKYTLTKPNDWSIKIQIGLTFVGKFINSILFPIWIFQEGISDAIYDLKQLWHNKFDLVEYVDENSPYWKALNAYYEA